ncbi:MAG TPA: sigma-E factor regulatory protein RseB domain-containing protein [Acidothermaceae bacterium]|jgi:outer membrane lipoprotein-sorting protein
MKRAFTTRRLRWALPAGVAAAIAVGSLTSSVTNSAAAEPNLPARTAAQLLVDLETANPPGFSGTIVETAKLGLPQLPDIGGSGGDSSLSLANLVTGAHTVRVWYGGHDKQRVALLGQLSESDIIRNGSDLWTYSSTDRRVTHSKLSASDHKGFSRHDVTGMTPQAAADAALKAIDPTTAVQVDRTARVAGRSAYQLLLTPKDSRSLIGSVRIAVDAQTSLPLRVQVFARDANSPAIQVGFTDVSFKTPDASVFNFVPPAGSTVTQGNPLTGPGGPGPNMPERIKDRAAAPSTGASAPGTSGPNSGPKMLGKGWTAVLEMQAPGLAAGSDNPGSNLAAILDKIATPTQGGRLVTSALFTVFIADDGRVYVGPVSADAIRQVAATGHGL